MSAATFSTPPHHHRPRELSDASPSRGGPHTTPAAASRRDCRPSPKLPPVAFGPAFVVDADSDFNDRSEIDTSGEETPKASRMIRKVMSVDEIGREVDGDETPVSLLLSSTASFDGSCIGFTLRLVATPLATPFPRPLFAMHPTLPPSRRSNQSMRTSTARLASQREFSKISPTRSSTPTYPLQTRVSSPNPSPSPTRTPVLKFAAIRLSLKLISPMMGMIFSPLFAFLENVSRWIRCA